MKKIVNYKFLNGHSDIQDLAKQVNQNINEGWQPFGSVLVTVIRGTDKIADGRVYPNDITLFNQPMVKYED
jgi:hypothetical protein